MSINSLRRRCKELRCKKSKRTVEGEKNTFEFIEKVFLLFLKSIEIVLKNVVSTVGSTLFWLFIVMVAGQLCNK